MVLLRYQSSGGLATKEVANASRAAELRTALGPELASIGLFYNGIPLSEDSELPTDAIVYAMPLPNPVKAAPAPNLTEVFKRPSKRRALAAVVNDEAALARLAAEQPALALHRRSRRFISSMAALAQLRQDSAAIYAAEPELASAVVALLAAAASIKDIPRLEEPHQYSIEFDLLEELEEETENSGAASTITADLLASALAAVNSQQPSGRRPPSTSQLNHPRPAAPPARVVPPMGSITADFLANIINQVSASAATRAAPAQASTQPPVPTSEPAASTLQFDPPAATGTAVADPFAAALAQLREMGVTDEATARNALEATGGDIMAALELLFQ